jgi:hypothetical protein
MTIAALDCVLCYNSNLRNAVEYRPLTLDGRCVSAALQKFLNVGAGRKVALRSL